MSDTENKIIEALAPKIYEDALQPAAKEVGKSLGNVVRAALLPVSGVVWTIDQAAEWVSKAVAERMEQKRITKDRISSPRPDVLGAVLVGLQVAGSEPELREMFASLLTSSMDSMTVQNSHPAFAEIIRQLTSDEAKILKVIGDSGDYPLLDVLVDWDSPNNMVTRNATLLGGKSQVQYPEMTSTYIDNICRVGITVIQRGEPQDNYLREHYEQLLKSSMIEQAKHPWVVRHPNMKFINQKKHLRINDFGNLFLTTCVKY
jgi:hypothetical protein